MAETCLYYALTYVALVIGFGNAPLRKICWCAWVKYAGVHLIDNIDKVSRRGRDLAKIEKIDPGTWISLLAYSHHSRRTTFFRNNFYFQICGY